MKATRVILGLTFVLLAPILVYWGSPNHGRLPAEESVIWSNPAVTGSSWGPVFLGRFYDSRQEGFRPAVRPVSTLVARIECGQFYQDRGAFQRTQIVLLLLAGLTFFWLLLRRYRSVSLAALSAVALVVHPIGANSVLCLDGVADLLAMLFFLLALWAADQALRPAEGSGRVRPMLLAWAFLLLSIWSKETGYLGVFVLWAMAYAATGSDDLSAGWGKTRKRAAVALSIGVSAVTVLALAHRILAFAALPEHLRLGRAVLIDTGLGWGHRVWTGLVSMPTVLRLFFLPTTMGHAHDFLLTVGIPIIRAAVGIVILILLGWLAVRQLQKRSPLSPWGILGFLGLLVSTGAVSSLGDFIPQGVLFFTLPGVIVTVAVGYRALHADHLTRLWRAVSLAWLVLLVGFLGFRTALREREYVDWETLVRAQTSSYPHSAQGWFDSGNILLTRGQLAGAVTEYETALKERPDCWMAWVNAGIAYMGEQEPGLAMRSFQKVLDGVKGKPEFAVVEARAEYNRALILMQQNRNAEAVQSFTKMLRIFPNHLAAHANLGMIYSNSEKFDQLSLLHLRRAMELETDPERMKSLVDVISRIEARRANLDRKSGIPPGSTP